MGANAQTTVPTFTAGQTLTAAQVNQINTGIPVASGTATRDGLFGGSGEKTLAEGQLVYVEGIGLQSYNGSAWVTWGTAPSTGGLVYLTGASFTTQTSVSLPNDTFTSTYRNYKVIFQITAVTSDADFTMRLRAAGTDDSNAQYDYALFGVDNGGGSGANGAALQTSWLFSEQDSATVRYTLNLDILAPQLTTPTYYNGFHNYLNKAGTSWVARMGAGIFRSTTSFDSLTFISSVASSITGVYRVYGYADS